MVLCLARYCSRNRWRLIAFNVPLNGIKESYQNNLLLCDCAASAMESLMIILIFNEKWIKLRSLLEGRESCVYKSIYICMENEPGQDLEAGGKSYIPLKEFVFY